MGQSNILFFNILDVQKTTQGRRYKMLQNRITLDSFKYTLWPYGGSSVRYFEENKNFYF